MEKQRISRNKIRKKRECRVTWADALPAAPEMARAAIGGVLSTLQQSSAAGQREASGKRNQLTNVRRYMMPCCPFTIAPATVTVFGQSAPVAEKAVRFQGSTPAGGPIELSFPHLS